MYEIVFATDLVGWMVISALGLIIGSFLNVVIHRLPLILEQRWRNEAHAVLAQADETPTTANFSLCYPSSHCPQCKTPILWRHKIPLLSFLFLKGRCAYCHATISMRYPAIESATMIVWLAIFTVYGISYLSVFGMLFASTLIVLACIDQNEGYLADEITMPLICLGLVLNCFGLIVSAQQAILGAALGYMSFFLLNYLFKAIRGHHGLGHGDMKLLAALGACLGWEILPVLVLIAALSGLAVYGAVQLKKRYALSDAIPFGPHLAFAGILSFLFYPQFKMSSAFIYSLSQGAN